MNSDTIHVMLSCDENFAQHAGVLIESLLSKATHPARVRLFLIDGGITEESKRKIQAIVDAHQASIAFIQVNPGDFGELYLSYQYSLAIYYRLMIGRLLPADVHRCIYMDCDMVVCDDIEKLWSEDLQGRPLGAVIDYGLMVSKKNYNEKIKELELKHGDLYFNSGLLIVDVDRWRQAGMDEKALNEAASRNHRSHDQDVLNLLFKGNWHPLPARWNCMPAIYGFNLKLFLQRRKFAGIVDARRQPGIVHFAGRYKPWEYPSKEGFSDKYYEALAKTLFADGFSPKPSPQNVHRSINSEMNRIRLGNFFYGMLP